MTAGTAIQATTRDELARAVEAYGLLVDDAALEPSPDAEQLTLDLYGSWYARPCGVAAPPADFPPDLVQVLRAADAGGDRWEHGWVVDRVAPTGAIIARNGTAVRLCGRPDYLADDRAALLPRTGDTVSVTGSRERVDDDGWWRTAGRAWKFTIGHPNLVRLYLNVDLGDVATLVRQTTTLLGDEQRPWMLKVASHVDAHVRADAAVLFVGVEVLDDRWRDISGVVAGLVDGDPVAAPPMTLRPQPGLAVAIDPGGVDSFGQHRCRLIVEALSGSPARDGDEVDRIVQRWAAEGIDVDRPWARRTDARLPWER